MYRIITHNELVAIASRWLCKSAGCGVVVTELVSNIMETPDAIGWGDGYSILIECKTSRGDFLVDFKKPFRQQGGIGDYRFYFAPLGLLQISEIPQGWGLLEWDGKKVLRTHNSPKGNIFYGWPKCEKNALNEISILKSVVRRLIENPTYLIGKVRTRAKILKA